MRVNLHMDPDTGELWFVLPLRTSDAVKAIVRKAIKPDREYESAGGTVLVKSVAPKRNNDNQRKP